MKRCVLSGLERREIERAEFGRDPGQADVGEVAGDDECDVVALGHAASRVVGERHGMVDPRRHTDVAA